MKIMEKETPAMAAYYKGCIEGLDLMTLDTTFAMKEILNDHLSVEMGWA